MSKLFLRRMVECALLIAIGTVLSLFQFMGPWALGGGITICSMLPLVFIAHRHGLKWGVVSALIYSVLQLLLGISNVSYAPNAWAAMGVIALDYVLAYTAIGFSACFSRACRDMRLSIAMGIAVTFFVRFLCHYVSGVVIWEALFPNELGWASAVWSLAYNASYMLPETIVTIAVALASYKPLAKYWRGEDLRAAH